MTTYTPEEIERDKRIIAEAPNGPWKHCADDVCKCRFVVGPDFPICEVTKGNWGDDFPSIRLVGESTLDLKAEAFMDQITYGTVDEETFLKIRDFIAAARTGWPKALEAIEARDKEIERLNTLWDRDIEALNRALDRATKAEALVALGDREIERLRAENELICIRAFAATNPANWQRPHTEKQRLERYECVLDEISKIHTERGAVTTLYDRATKAEAIVAERDKEIERLKASCDFKDRNNKSLQDAYEGQGCWKDRATKAEAERDEAVGHLQWAIEYGGWERELDGNPLMKKAFDDAQGFLARHKDS